MFGLSQWNHIILVQTGMPQGKWPHVGAGFGMPWLYCQTIGHAFQTGLLPKGLEARGDPIYSSCQEGMKYRCIDNIQPSFLHIPSVFITVNSRTQCGQIHFQLWGRMKKKFCLSGERCRKNHILISEKEMIVMVKIFLGLSLSETTSILDQKVLWTFQNKGG